MCSFALCDCTEEAGAGGIEEMDVDAFMNGGMFGLDVDENGKQYDEGSETEEGTEDEEGEEGEEDEKEDDDELLNGGDDTENVRLAYHPAL